MSTIPLHQSLYAVSQRQQTSINLSTLKKSNTSVQCLTSPFRTRQINQWKFWKHLYPFPIFIFDHFLDPDLHNRMWSWRYNISVCRFCEPIFTSNLKHLQKFFDVFSLDFMNALDIYTLGCLLEFQLPTCVAKKIDNVFVVDLNVAHSCLVCFRSQFLVEKGDGKLHNSGDCVGTHHCIGFSCPCCSICKHSCIKPFQHILHQLFHRFIKYLNLRNLGIEDIIKSINLFFLFLVKVILWHN